jgi:hypothetical protein
MVNAPAMSLRPNDLSLTDAGPPEPLRSLGYLIKRL